MAPAIHHAANGFGASVRLCPSLRSVCRSVCQSAVCLLAAQEYLASIIKNSAPLLSRFPATSAVFMPGGSPPAPGDPILQTDLAESYRLIAEQV